MSVAAAQRPPPALALLKKANELPLSAIKAAGFETVEALAQHVANQFKLPRVEIDDVELSPGLAAIIPRALAERHDFVPVFETDGEITIASADPSRFELFDWLSREVHRHILVVVASPAEIGRAQTRLYEPTETLRPASLDDQAADPSAEAILQATPFVNELVLRAVELGASDIHIEAGEKESVVRYRVDGMLRVAHRRPSDLHPALVSRLKVMAQLDIAERQVPQDGRIKILRAKGDIDLRVSVLPTYWGEKVCCRILDNTKARLSLPDLGFEPDQLAIFERMVRVPFGLLLVTGPTGSGKSTTLYGALNSVRSPELNIVSVEDPVEYQLEGINQVPVNVKRGLTFAKALRSILRQDPNVILVGEIRDQETGVIAAEAALTGHLVMASLHTNDAASAITRLTEMGVEPYLVAPALVGIIAQRLVRKICSGCVEQYDPSEQELDALGLASLPPGLRLSRGVGCEACQGTGYRGRAAVRELLEASAEIKAAVSAGAHADEIRRVADAGGFRSMRFQALRRLFAGVTTAQEVLRVTKGG